MSAPAGIRVGFAGTPEFARVALAALLDAGCTVPLVLTQPDRPAGRGLKLHASAVKQLAQAHGLALAQPRSLRLDGKFPDDAQAAQQVLQAADLDVLVVAAYGLILPPWVLALPRHGCLNIHGSLLPRWRGAAPDTGAMLLSAAIELGAEDTSATLHDQLATLGAQCLLQTLALLARGTLHAQAQPTEGATYAHKIEKGEAAIDWGDSAAVIERRLRAFDPFPGCTTKLTGQPLKLWRAAVVPGAGTPGTRLPAEPGRLVVACGEGALELLEMQLAGGKRISAREFLQRHPLQPA